MTTGQDGPGKRPPKKKVVPRKQQRSRGTGKHLARSNVLTTFVRNHNICCDKIGGLTTEYVAAKHGVSVSTVNKVMSEWRVYIAIALDEDIIEFIEKQMARYEILFGKLAEIVESSASDTDKISAIREQMHAIKEAITLRQSTGVLPNDLGDVRVHIDFTAIGRRLADAMDDEHVPLASQERIIDVIAGTVNESASSNGS